MIGAIADISLDLLNVTVDKTAVSCPTLQGPLPLKELKIRIMIWVPPPTVIILSNDKKRELSQDTSIMKEALSLKIELHLKWNDFESNIKLGFSELRQDEDFYDLPARAEQVKAHKVILSACSPFFRSLIKSVSHAHPLLYLRGIKFSHLEALLSFMYNGEVSVTQEELTEFLSIAEELKIRGLTQEGSSSSSSGTVVPKEETLTPTPNKRPRLNHKPASNALHSSNRNSSSKHAHPSYDTEFHEEKYIPEDEESANFLSRVEDGMEAEEDVDFLNTEEQHSSSYTSDHLHPLLL
ncbi:Broad-complex core protein isoform 6 [Caligus rogercresseyi]|uniref:Broad-complex core protein isoform 6 n=1 Tax=Caligus rogercresseyi TaxID=217165 RepID=A0A7T8GTB1_CALRO|nr:Broad-complex core protein isoform 6 [Caligus rogercresseyi]